MRTILIVGAGQAGLQLALCLLEQDYDVTIVSARTPGEMRAGHITSTQIMFGTALRYERDHDLDLWQRAAPTIDGLRFSVVGARNERTMDWIGRFRSAPQSVDQRVKMPRWLELFEQRGGTVLYCEASPQDVADLHSDYDLVLIAAGRGPLAELFAREERWSPYVEPQRALSVSYVEGMRSCGDEPEGMTLARFTPIPGVGEFFAIPAHTHTGSCEIAFFEGIPGGPLDCFADRPTAAEHWQRMRGLLARHVPWEYERLRDAELTDAKATLAGGVTPVVRQPVARLPGGGLVLGMADVLVTNDPITGQGSNNASRCAEWYLRGILERGDAPFDEAWMRDRFARFWEHARYTTMWSNASVAPAAEHTRRVFAAATRSPEVAERFVNGFDDPKDVVEWFLDPVAAEDYLRAVGAV